MTAKKTGGDGPATESAAQGKPGAPTKFRLEYVQQVRKLCQDGKTDVELADFFAVSRATLSTWKREYPDFLDALKHGKALADAPVVRSLLRNATGYDYTEQQAIKIKVGPSQEEVKIVEVTRHMPGETRAAFIWLQNRQPEEWRDKQIHEHTGLDGKPIESITTTMTAKEAADRYRDELG